MTSKEELIEEIAQEIGYHSNFGGTDDDCIMYCAKQIYNIMERWIVENV